ncbi:methyltransferase domain-containing protein [Calothrix rhizosoleniae]|uniref:methyltransferase domain-containing protein n=1 Tax=Calothrix rhizosoleniae TaxID=888997 RepID=UPI001F21F6C7|nr:methyltransferase domain-containing protein [Calothrix rhizosoleniae]
MKILIDGVAFSQAQDQKAIDFWQQLMPRLTLRLKGENIYYLNRNSDIDFPDLTSLHNLYAPSVDYSLSALEDRRLASLCRELNIDVFISTYNTSAGSGVKTLFIDLGNSDDVNIVSSKQRSLRFTSFYLAIYQENIKELQKYVNLASENIQAIYADSNHELDWITVANFVAKTTINLSAYQLSQEVARIQLAEEEATQAEALQLRKQAYGEEAYKNFYQSTSYKIEQKQKANLATIAGFKSSVNYEYDDNWQLTTPVAFLIFNRPDTTARVFEVIRQAKPPKLLVVADGARVDKPGEAEKCAATRAIINQVDWECEILTNYSEVNLGCRKRVSSGLDWVFEQVEEAIILEDDCLPHPTFFRYCQELLDKYRDDERIMMISGDNFQFGQKRTEYSYYFSRYGHCWGWASWRRAWTNYDDYMQKWPELRDNGWLNSVLQNEQTIAYWSKIFQGVYDGFNTWDYIWLFTLWANNGLTILPHENLVSNIGFGSGTHTIMSNSQFANMPVEVMNFPLKHPRMINRNIEADDFTEKTQFSGVISQPQKREITYTNTIQSVQKCKVCNSDSFHLSTAKILQKYEVNYFQCSHCGFVQTEHPYWLDEAYSEAIAVSDVGLVYRNNIMANITGKLLFNYFDHQAKFLDYGGGYGLFVRLMRDQGFDFYWFDKFCKNIFARGFDLQKDDKQNLELITAFELFEHLTNPLQELKEIINLCPNILFSTELLPEDNPTPDKWWYYTPHEGQHISIYTRKSLEILASKHNLKLHTNGKSLHLLTTKEDLPENLFEQLAQNELQPTNKESLLSRDFNQIVNNIVLKDRGLNAKELEINPETQQPIIIFDGVFFQLYKTGIARVWRSLLQEWANNEFSKHIVVLDRAGTAPKIPGIRYRTIPAYSYNNTDADREMLQQVCDEENADLFISSYYTTPITTPSVFMAYDMIPEVMRWDMNNPMWQEKHRAIQQASAYIAISKHTAHDLSNFFTNISLEDITVARCGVKNTFSPAKAEDINAFKIEYGITKPYFILIGVGTGYKNSILFFQAFSKLATSQGFDIVCTGSGGVLAPEFRNHSSGSTAHMLQLSDEELAIAYSGAVALVYPSKYEGFGMPIAEAMACGCPVITCANASIPEVAGKAAIYVNDDDIEATVNALCEVQKPVIRNTLIAAGLEQVKQFSWSTMADTVSSVLINTTPLCLNLKENNLIVFPDWNQSEESIGLELQAVIKTLATYPDSQKTTLLIDTSNIAVEDAEMFLSSVAMNLLMESDLDMTEELQISLIGELSNIQWKTLLSSIQARIILENDNQEAVMKLSMTKLPQRKLESFQLSAV